MDYKSKYIKYKTKYLALKKMSGGFNNNFEIGDFINITWTDACVQYTESDPGCRTLGIIVDKTIVDDPIIDPNEQQRNVHYKVFVNDYINYKENEAYSKEFYFDVDTNGHIMLIDRGTFDRFHPNPRKLDTSKGMKLKYIAMMNGFREKYSECYNKILHSEENKLIVLMDDDKMDKIIKYIKDN